MNIKLEIIQPNTVPHLSYILYKKKKKKKVSFHCFYELKQMGEQTWIYNKNKLSFTNEARCVKELSKMSSAKSIYM